MSDPEFASRHRVSRQAAQHKRQEFGIAPSRGFHSWSQSDLRALEKGGSVEEFAARIGATVAAVRVRRRTAGLAKPQHRWTKKQIGLLGTIPDRALSKRLGLTVYSVKWKRQSLGIESHLSREKRRRG